MRADRMPAQHLFMLCASVRYSSVRSSCSVHEMATWRLGSTGQHHKFALNQPHDANERAALADAPALQEQAWHQHPKVAHPVQLTNYSCPAMGQAR